MATIVHSIIWSVDTEILKNGNANNAVGKMSLLDRLGLLGKVVQEAYMLGTGKWRGGSLEERTQLMYMLFTAPEYLFAYSDKQHLITESNKQGLVRSLAVLSKDVPLMILMPGSIAWKKPLIRGDTSSRIEKFEARMHLNAEAQMHQAPDYVFRTINSETDLTRRLKQFDEREDILEHRKRQIQLATDMSLQRMRKNALASPERCYLARNTAYAFHDGKEVGRYHKRADFHEVFPDESDEKFVLFMPGGGGNNHRDRFTVGPIRFGLEICADHEVGYLSSAKGPQPHVHVVLSAKVRFNPTHAAAAQNGYVVHACSDDGLSAVYHSGQAIKEVQAESHNSAFLGRLHYHRLVLQG